MMKYNVSFISFAVGHSRELSLFREQIARHLYDVRTTKRECLRNDERVILIGIVRGTVEEKTSRSSSLSSVTVDPFLFSSTESAHAPPLRHGASGKGILSLFLVSFIFPSPLSPLRYS